MNDERGIEKYKGNGVLPCVSKRYLITFYSSTGGIGFEIKIDAESKEDAENKARDMNSSVYFTIDEIV